MLPWDGTVSHASSSPRPDYLERDVTELPLTPDLLHDDITSSRQVVNGKMNQILEFFAENVSHRQQELRTLPIEPFELP